jgi:class 3 adenylate cyclase
MDTDWGPFYDRPMPVCQRCGEDNPERARFCLACGAPLAAPISARREERKRLSVLFCDLVGFTSRSEQLDIEDVRGVLTPYYQRLRSELERFGGTVEKLIRSGRSGPPWPSGKPSPSSTGRILAWICMCGSG